MFVREMTESECLDLLARTGFGRLACAHENQPYVVPFYFAYRAGYIYSFATMGQKIHWMRANALVCVEADVVENSQEWVSVIAFGRYDELPDNPEHWRERQVAQEVLQRRSMWWQPAFVATTSDSEAHSRVPVFYRIKIELITGHRATRSS
jgi:nitroimidazol reductase NimA-like FMN-containing flavoprotein (pyridoxamine 5'-phosphate oxidase superfamily)